MLKSEIKGTASPNTMDTAYIYNMYEDYKKLQEKVLAEKERRIKELETKLAKLEQQELSTTSSDFHAEIAKKKAELIAYIRLFRATRCPDHKIKIIIE